MIDKVKLRLGDDLAIAGVDDTYRVIHIGRQVLGVLVKEVDKSSLDLIGSGKAVYEGREYMVMACDEDVFTICHFASIKI